MRHVGRAPPDDPRRTWGCDRPSGCHGGGAVTVAPPAVVKGKVTLKTASGEETFETGDAYYVGPGHTPSCTPALRS